MTPDDLRARRASLGLTQAQLGERLGVPQATINRWESGKRVMERATMIDLALKQLESEMQQTTQYSPEAQRQMAATCDARQAVTFINRIIRNEPYGIDPAAIILARYCPTPDAVFDLDAAERFAAEVRREQPNNIPESERGVPGPDGDFLWAETWTDALDEMVDRALTERARSGVVVVHGGEHYPLRGTPSGGWTAFHQSGNPESEGGSIVSPSAAVRESAERWADWLRTQARRA